MQLLEHTLDAREDIRFLNGYLPATPFDLKSRNTDSQFNRWQPSLGQGGGDFAVVTRLPFPQSRLDPSHVQE
jgi:hypothetical protein